MQLSPHGLPASQYLQHSRTGGGAGGSARTTVLGRAFFEVFDLGAAGSSTKSKPPAQPFWRGGRVVGQGLGPNDDEAISKA